MIRFLIFAISILPIHCTANANDLGNTICLVAQEKTNRVILSADLGWKADKDVTEAFRKLLNTGKISPGDELRLQHTYRISGHHRLPDKFTLSASKGAGFDVTDAVRPKNNRCLLELGNQTVLRNLTISYLNTPPLGPTGGKHEVDFTRRLGIQARGKRGIKLENCKLTGSISHHLKLSNCNDIQVVGTHIVGGHWSVVLSACDDLVFRNCLIEKCQGDGIKTSGGEKGIVQRVVVDNCVFQDNLRDGIDTTGGFNRSTVKNCTFRRMGVSGLDLKSHYESRSGKIDDLKPENVGILIENCKFHDLPNAVVITTLDCGRRRGIGQELLNEKNIAKYAPHDITLNDCVIGHSETPLRSVEDGGYGVNYPTEENEHMRMLLVKDAYDIRYKNARFYGDRIQPVYLSSIGGSNHLSEEAAEALTPTVKGNVIDKPAKKIKPGITKVDFECGPK